MTDVQTRQTAEMMCGHMLNHISDPPEGASAAAEGTAQAVAGLSNVARFVQQRQPEKDQEEQDSSKPEVGSGPAVSVDRERTYVGNLCWREIIPAESVPFHSTMLPV